MRKERAYVEGTTDGRYAVIDADFEIELKRFGTSREAWDHVAVLTSCVRKESFRVWQEALDSAAKGNDTRVAYECKLCGRWHMSTTVERNTNYQQVNAKRFLHPLPGNLEQIRQQIPRNHHYQPPE